MASLSQDKYLINFLGETMFIVDFFASIFTAVLRFFGFAKPPKTVEPTVTITPLLVDSNARVNVITTTAVIGEEPVMPVVDAEVPKAKKSIAKRAPAAKKAAPKKPAAAVKKTRKNNR